MNAKQTAQAATEYRRYMASPAYRAEMERDRKRRAAADKAQGHTPQCGLMDCAPGCTYTGWKRNA